MLAESPGRAAGDAIRVVCRFRPQNGREIKEGGVPVVNFDDDMTSVRFDSKEYPGTFNFDRVFDWGSTQEHVFDYAASATIDDVMRGYNGTIFAYGQTGSGKTHTMMGDMESEDLKGLTPRIVESIFSTIYAAPSHIEFTVRVSYMEIYMEKIRDLLNPANDNLPIHEEKSRGVYVKGLLEVFVGSVNEVFEAMRRGQSSRMVAHTNMNAESSRSHSIFQLTINQKNLNDGTQRSGKLSLVDLAGSEKVGKTGASGQTLEEAKKINKSLSALGMVINALTDGKSSHIPYRDSKLTRILQESLGGNSRTTLIINCSPSSFNEAETLSTLRFGMRAKTIKNKAKINAELSPGELKALLKRSKADLASMQTYCNALEGELGIWRTGGTVPEKDWVTPTNLGNSDRPAAPSAIPPNIAELTNRSSTPALPITDDEREDFLKRENELSDQLAEKEAALERTKKELETLNEELSSIRKDDSDLATQNKELNASVAELKLQLEKLTFENKDSAITVDSLKDANTELAKEIEELKKRIIEVQSSQPVMAVNEEDIEKKKREKMALMMAEFDPSASLSEKERSIRASLAKLALNQPSTPAPTTPEEIEAQHREFLELKSQFAQQAIVLDELMGRIKIVEEERNRVGKRKEELEVRVGALEREYEELVERTIREEVAGAGEEVVGMFEDLKAKLEKVYENRKESQDKEVDDFKAILALKDEEIARMQNTVSEQTKLTQELKTAIETVKNSGASMSSIPEDNEELQKLKRNMSQQLAEFDAMKKRLMRDLQNRCEKVVELEISLDTVREQYNNVLRTSNSHATQQKLAFLERNMSQLTAVQKTLVEQNNSLKKDNVLLERKLRARDERIASLEALMNDTNMKLEMQNKSYEAQLAAMREKLQEARSQNPTPTSSSWLASSRIAKPLRGGGGSFLPASLGGAPAAESDSGVGMSVAYGDSDNGTRDRRPPSWYVTLLSKK